jgi:hypothetical protein
MEPRMKYKGKQQFKKICFGNPINTLIPTLFQSKFSTSVIPKSQPSQNNTPLAIRHKTKNRSMLVFIPVIHENKWYVNCLCSFFPFAQWIQWHTVMIHRLFSHTVYWLRTDRGMVVVFKSVQFFFSSSCAKFYIQTSEWTQVLKELQRHYLIFGYDKIPLKFLLHFL